MKSEQISFVEHVEQEYSHPNLDLNYYQNLETITKLENGIDIPVKILDRDIFICILINNIDQIQSQNEVDINLRLVCSNLKQIVEVIDLFEMDAYLSCLWNIDLSFNTNISNISKRLLSDGVLNNDNEGFIHFNENSSNLEVSTLICFNFSLILYAIQNDVQKIYRNKILEIYSLISNKYHNILLTDKGGSFISNARKRIKNNHAENKMQLHSRLMEHIQQLHTNNTEFNDDFIEKVWEIEYNLNVQNRKNFDDYLADLRKKGHYKTKNRSLYTNIISAFNNYQYLVTGDAKNLSYVFGKVHNYYLNGNYYYKQ